MKLIYLFPIKSEWGIHAPTILPSTNYSRRHSLEDACHVAIKLLQCEFLPFDPESIRIYQLRAEGGGCQVLEHIPTGMKKQLTRPTAKGREVMRRRCDALDELAYDLALGTSGGIKG